MSARTFSERIEDLQYQTRLLTLTSRTLSITSNIQSIRMSMGNLNRLMDRNRLELRRVSQEYNLLELRVAVRRQYRRHRAAMTELKIHGGVSEA